MQTEALPDQAHHRSLGGHGLGVHLLYDRLLASAGAVRPENVLAFLPELLAGSGAPFGGRRMVAAKLPLIGELGFAGHC